MANKTFKSRLQMKSDTTAHWNSLTNFVPLKGEIIVYEDMQPLGIKVGNGESYLHNLQFSSVPQAGAEGDIVRVQPDGNFASETITIINGGNSFNMLEADFANAEAVSF